MLDWEPELQEIPPGEFVMGDVWGDGEPDEQPVYPIFMEAFRLGRYAITNSQFAFFLNETGLAPEAEMKEVADLHAGVGGLFLDGDQVRCKPGREHYPATYISWHGAVRYCDWLREKTGLAVRLPREAEWQYASMGPQRHKWALGESFVREHYICGCDGPAPVDWGAPSSLGLYNMTGNVFEWCADEYSYSLAGERSEIVLPQNRVIKGGAFILSESANLRNAKRFSCHESSCLASIGFRVVAPL
jgi:formylglycine-generating enzyme required for sulfatase activity